MPGGSPDTQCRRFFLAITLGGRIYTRARAGGDRSMTDGDCPALVDDATVILVDSLERAFQHKPDVYT